MVISIVTTKIASVYLAINLTSETGNTHNN